MSESTPRAPRFLNPTDARRPIDSVPVSRPIVSASPVPAPPLATIARQDRAISFPHWIYPALVLTWVTGTMFLLTWLLMGTLRLRLLHRKCYRVEGDAAHSYRELCAQFGLPTPELRTGKCIHTPFVAGVRRSTIYLPEQLVAWKPDARNEGPQSNEGSQEGMLRAILLHELAHIQNRDCAWVLLARICCAICWPNVLLWKVCGRLEADTEAVCDQEVVGQSVSAQDYARCLLALAERMNGMARRFQLKTGALGSRSTLARRIEEVLAASRRPPRTASLGERLLIAAGVGFGATMGLCVFAIARPASRHRTPPEGQALAAQKSVLPGAVSDSQLVAKYAEVHNAQPIITAYGQVKLSGKSGNGSPDITVTGERIQIQQTADGHYAFGPNVTLSISAKDGTESRTPKRAASDLTTRAEAKRVVEIEALRRDMARTEALLTEFEAQRVQQQQENEELRLKFTASHPLMIASETKLKRIQAQIDHETAREVEMRVHLAKLLAGNKAALAEMLKPVESGWSDGNKASLSSILGRLQTEKDRSRYEAAFQQLDALKQQLDASRQELEQLRLRYREETPQVREMQERIHAIQQQLEASQAEVERLRTQSDRHTGRADNVTPWRHSNLSVDYSLQKATNVQTAPVFSARPLHLDMQWSPNSIVTTKPVETLRERFLPNMNQSTSLQSSIQWKTRKPTLDIPFVDVKSMPGKDNLPTDEVKYNIHAGNAYDLVMDFGTRLLVDYYDANKQLLAHKSIPIDLYRHLSMSRDNAYAAILDGRGAERAKMNAPKGAVTAAYAYQATANLLDNTLRLAGKNVDPLVASDTVFPADAQAATVTRMSDWQTVTLAEVLLSGKPLDTVALPKVLPSLNFGIAFICYPDKPTSVRAFGDKALLKAHGLEEEEEIIAINTIPVEKITTQPGLSAEMEKPVVILSLKPGRDGKNRYVRLRWEGHDEPVYTLFNPNGNIKREDAFGSKLGLRY